MKNKIAKISIPEVIFDQIREHLVDHDEKEAICFALCGIARRSEGNFLAIKRIIKVPYETCRRSKNSITWSSRIVLDVINASLQEELAILKIHSHPPGARYFSGVDDKSDGELFPKLYDLTSNEFIHGSVVITKDLEILGRTVDKNGHFYTIPKIIVAGDNISIHFGKDYFQGTPLHKKRISQLFGEGTTSILSRLKIGVIGASGTGSPTITQLERNGVGEIVSIDPKISRDENLNRISQLKKSDVDAGKFKVEVIAEDIIRNGLGTKVTPLANNILDEESILELSTCDIIIGCMDSALGRHVANKISSFYVIPLIDIGVQLKADGNGGIRSIWGSYHYIKPGGESLLSKKVYKMADVEAEIIKMTDPEHFADLEARKYIKGAEESSPAVISFNMRISADAIIDLLARIHPFRDEANSTFNTFRYNFCEGEVYKDSEGESCRVFLKGLSNGDQSPLLGLTGLVQKKERNRKSDDAII